MDAILETLRVQANRVVGMADGVAAGGYHPEVAELAEAVATLAATVGALAAVLRDERRGN